MTLRVSKGNLWILKLRGEPSEISLPEIPGTEQYNYLNALSYVRLVPNCSLKQVCRLLYLSCQLL